MTTRTRYQARETLYRGTLMRSRLEATSAGMLDEMGIEWEYEPCCFADGADQYLPDFRLWPRQAKSWYLEIKPESLWQGWPPPSGSELDLALQRMVIIRASIPDAILMLWMPDVNCSCGGRLIVHWPNHQDFEKGWNSYSARSWLGNIVDHNSGKHLAIPSEEPAA